MAGLRLLWSDPALRVIAVLMMLFGAVVCTFGPYVSVLAVEVFGLGDRGFAALLVTSTALSVAASVWVGIRADQTAGRRSIALVSCGLLAGGAAGSVLSGGLNDLLKQFQDQGHTETANSWVGTGPNKQISPGDLASALGADQINTLTSQTGLSRDELLSGLAKQLPDIINQLTPDGRLPTEREASRWI